MKKAFSMILCLVMALSIFTAAPFTANSAEVNAAQTGAASGTTGDCTWTLNGTELTISGSGNMGDYVFESPWGTGVTKVTIEDGVTSIGSNAFYDCTSLTSVTIGSTVMTIGSFAFFGCTGLRYFDIPDSVTSIGGGAFTYTAWYNKQPDGLVYVGKFAYEMKGECPSEVVIRDGTLRIAGSAFSGYTDLTRVEIPDSVISIGDYAFYGCSGLTSVKIGDSVTSIGDSAFRECAGLTGVDIPDSVISIGGYAFMDCADLKTIDIPDSVISIGDFAFSGCSVLSKITIGDSVEAIGIKAFHNCPSLTSVAIPDTATEIGEKAFGFYYSSDIGKTMTVEGFTICGVAGSSAQRYAEDNGFTFTPIGETPTEVILGDADGDGDVTILDATAIQRVIAELLVQGFDEAAADADEDGDVTILDATAIQRFIAELSTNENIGKPIG